MPDLPVWTVTTSSTTGDWGNWNRVYTATTTTTNSTVNLWQTWNDDMRRAIAEVQGFGGQVAMADAATASVAALGRKIEDIEKERKAAERRARALLNEHLEPKQRRELRDSGRFHVVGADEKTYRLTRSWAHNAFLIEDGILAEQFCIHPRSMIPVDDHLLAQKLLLETDPATFRRIANVTPMRHLRRAA